MQNNLKDTFVRDCGSSSDSEYITWLEKLVISLENKVENFNDLTTKQGSEPLGEITPSWCKAKECQYTWQKCDEEICSFDKRAE